MPHVDGAFRQHLVAEALQCHKLADGVSLSEGAFAEPLAVTVHAVNRAGSLLNKRVLITGSGPIGALCIVAARAHGAREIVVTDVMDGPLGFARAVGADETIDVAREPERLSAYGAGKGTFDVMFEASGYAAALAAGIEVRVASLFNWASAMAIWRCRRIRLSPRKSKCAVLSAFTRNSRSRSISSTSAASMSGHCSAIHFRSTMQSPLSN
jgi:threonine dehydrogenase-like Zn-dependent dehydrogenase